MKCIYSRAQDSTIWSDHELAEPIFFLDRLALNRIGMWDAPKVAVPFRLK
jgi:hypothetical protein